MKEEIHIFDKVLLLAFYFCSPVLSGVLSELGFAWLFQEKHEFLHLYLLPDLQYILKIKEFFLNKYFDSYLKNLKQGMNGNELQVYIRWDKTGNFSCVLKRVRNLGKKCLKFLIGN